MTTDGHVLRCQVRGSVAPLLKMLADAGVTKLLISEPSLEELFLAQYGGTVVEPVAVGHDAG